MAYIALVVALIRPCTRLQGNIPRGPQARGVYSHKPPNTSRWYITDLYPVAWADQSTDADNISYIPRKRHIFPGSRHIFPGNGHIFPGNG